MSSLSPQIALPLVLIGSFMALFVGFALRTLMTDRRVYARAQRLTGSAKNAAKGTVASEAAYCQTAFKTDPRSASNIDPSSLCSRTGGEARSGQLAQRVAA